MNSELCTYNMATDAVRVVLRCSRRIEAPNWAGDGNALLVNSDGRLFRVDLARPSPALTPVRTGFAERLNNDHGLSPDGKWLAITDKTETGAACIYVLPSGGGTPSRVTGSVPSYWHGWSPDGGTLVYTARRDGALCICTCPASGGAEQRLIDGFDGCDGPDYSPDGQWVWFTGVRNGYPALWRIRPDGTAAEQMTHGPEADWFPHPSPDGRWVVFLSYSSGTVGFPPDTEVRLRCMPAQGGAPRDLLALRGGQGTINVPSWAPDGHAFAFVRYPEA